MIDWIELSKSFPDFVLTIFVVVVIIYFNKDNKATAQATMADWRIYLAEQAKEFANTLLNQDKLFIEHLAERQKVFDLRLQSQEQLFSKSLSEVVTKHELEVSKITAQNQILITSTVDNLTSAVKRNSVDVRELIKLQMKVAKKENS